MAGVPYQLSETPGKVYRPVTLAGQDTENVLRELGYTGEEVQRLMREGVAEVAPKPADTSAGDSNGPSF